MKATLAQIAPKLGRFDDNLATHRQIVSDAWTAGRDLVVFPELSLTGYLLRDHVPHVAVPAADLPALFDGLRPGAAALEISLGFVELSLGCQCFNSAAHLRLVPDGLPELLSVHRKVHLPTYGMFDERRYWAAGQMLRSFESPLLGRAGLLLCEDLWHPATVWLLSVDGPHLEGIQCLLALANSPARGVQDTQQETVANLETWRRLNRLYASLFGLVLFHCQRVGVEDSYVFTGGSEVLAPTGEPLARADLFNEELLEVELDLPDLIRWHRSVSPFSMADDVTVVQRELQRVVAEAWR